MARTREAASKKTNPAPKQPTVAELRRRAKALGLKGYSRKTIEELTVLIAEADRPVQSPATYDPKIEVLPTGFVVTPTVEVRVDGQLEIKTLTIANPDDTPFEPPNVQALLNWLVMDSAGGYKQLLDEFCTAKTAEIRKLLLDRFVQLSANGGEPG